MSSGHFSYGHGSIPINTIFSGMNIHKSQLFWCELQGYYWFWHTAIWPLVFFHSEFHVKKTHEDFQLPCLTRENSGNFAIAEKTPGTLWGSKIFSMGSQRIGIDVWLVISCWWLVAGAKLAAGRSQTFQEPNRGLFSREFHRTWVVFQFQCHTENKKNSQQSAQISCVFLRRLCCWVALLPANLRGDLPACLLALGHLDDVHHGHLLSWWVGRGSQTHCQKLCAGMVMLRCSVSAWCFLFSFSYDDCYCY